MQTTGQKHICGDCGREYQTLETLNRHRRNHLESVSYDCTVCGASFKRKDLLNKHSRIHVNPRYRSQRACLRCSWLKLRCDNGVPCSRCVANAKECVYRPNRNNTTPTSETTVPQTSSDETWNSLVSSIEDPIDLENFDWSLDTDLSPGSQSSASRDSTWTDVVQTVDPQNQTIFGFLPESTTPNLGYPLQNLVTTPAQTVSSILAWSNPHGTPSPYHSSPIEASGLSSNQIDLTPTNLRAERLGPSQADITSLDRHDVLSNLVQEAFSPVACSNDHTARAAYWARKASEVEKAFGMQRYERGHKHVFDRFLALYFQHFHPKWPIIWKRGVVREDLPPHTYLVMTVIGATYGNAEGMSYHVEMLKILSARLVQSCYEQHASLEAVSLLTQSLILLQVSILYFGRSDCFSVCHRIMGAWIPVCRQFGLFEEMQDQERTRDSFVRSETRRRLGITFLQLETAISALLGSRPLLHYSELLTWLPVPDYIWLSEDIDDIVAFQAYSRKETRPRSFAEIVGIALHPSSEMPMLQVHELEVVLHGLLHYAWGYPAQYRMMYQQTATSSDAMSSQAGPSSTQSSTKTTTDQMQQLQLGTTNVPHELACLVEALRRCRVIMEQNKSVAHTIFDRTSLLTSIFLHGISVVWLNADILSLCKLARSSCARAMNLPSSTAAIDAYAWANSDAALSSVEAACYHWARTADELAVPESMRAEFKIVAHIALLYSAIVVWVFSACRREESTMRLDQFCASATTQSPTVDLRLRRENNGRLLQSFADLLLKIQPMRQQGRSGFAVYHDIVSVLSQRPFPLPW